jgi:hypothetical protein
MKGVFSLLASAGFLCLLTTTGLTNDDLSRWEGARQKEPLLSTWDKPAFAPAPSMDSVPWLNSRPAKGPHVDFLLSPEVESLGPLRAQKGNWPASSEMPPCFAPSPRW